jgi:hypothetical protein
MPPRRRSALLFLAVALVSGALPAAATFVRAGAAADPPGGPETDWPTTVDGRPLQPRPLTAVERRFARQFPGRVARFSDGDREWVFRRVHRPTRRLHAAADCFRAVGYGVQPAGVRSDRHGEPWGCFHAARGGGRLLVCERIRDERGRGWTDVSSWYWSALFSGGGPWWAVTVVTVE